MASSHIHARKEGAPRTVVEDWTLIASMRDGITQSQIAIDQSLAIIASTRAAIALLDQLQARRNPSAGLKIRRGPPALGPSAFSKAPKR